MILLERALDLCGVEGVVSLSSKLSETSVVRESSAAILYSNEYYALNQSGELNGDRWSERAGYGRRQIQVTLKSRCGQMLKEGNVRITTPRHLTQPKSVEIVLVMRTARTSQK